MFHCPINAIRTYMWIQLDPVLGATLVTGNMAPKSGLAPILKVDIFSVLKMWKFLCKKSFLSISTTNLVKEISDLIKI